MSESVAPYARAQALVQIGILKIKEYTAQISALKNSSLYFRGLLSVPGKTLGEIAGHVIAILNDKTVLEMDAETEDETFLNHQIKIMFNKGGINDAEQRHAIESIRAFYRAGRFKERIASLDGCVISKHIDGSGEICFENHVDAPEVIFHL